MGIGRGLWKWGDDRGNKVMLLGRKWGDDQGNKAILLAME